MISELSVEFLDHKHSKLKVCIVHDPWGVADGDLVPKFLRLSVGGLDGQETEFFVSREAAARLLRSLEHGLIELART